MNNHRHTFRPARPAQPLGTRRVLGVALTLGS